MGEGKDTAGANGAGRSGEPGLTGSGHRGPHGQQAGAFDVETPAPRGAGAAPDKDAGAPVAVAAAAAGGPEAEPGAIVEHVSFADIAKQFSLLGWTAFGGPAAHIGIMQKRLVDKLRWMSTEVYTELFALAQCMPGPASTQVSFACGIIKRGMPGGLLSGVLFQYPGAIIMAAVGVLAAEYLAKPKGWLLGLTAGVSAVGVAMVASAAKAMAGKLCAGWLRASICTVAVVVAYYWPQAYTFPALIVAGGLVTLVWSWARKEPVPQSTTSDESIRSHGVNRVWGAILLAVWVAVLVVCIVLVSALKPAPLLLRWWEAFYRIGSIIYGGGQVVLPMLYTEVVQQTCDAAGACTDAPNTWVTSKQFYAGLGVVQALPGPLFNFSSYLGAIMAMNSGYVFVIGSLLAWFGLFSPGVLIIFGVMPFWGKFRNWPVYKRALPGFNAAGVGLIITSVFTLTLGAMKESPFPMASLCLGVLAFTAVDQLKLFEPAVVVGGGALGVAAWALKMK